MRVIWDVFFFSLEARKANSQTIHEKLNKKYQIILADMTKKN